MPKFEYWFKQDLKKPVRVNDLSGVVFTLDNVGSRIGVEVFDDGEPVTLTGTVNGYVIIPGETTVSVAGTRSNNKAYIELPQSALATPGFIKIAIKLTNSSEITTLLAVVSTVYKSRTDTIITPSQQIITDWSQQIAAEMQAVEDASAAQDAKIDDLKSASFDKSTSNNWEDGSFSPTSGNVYDVSNFSRCLDFFSFENGDNFVTSNTTLRIFAYQLNGTYVGIYKNNGTFATGTSNEANVTTFIFSDWPDYMFHVVIKSAETTERSNVFIYTDKLLDKIDDISAEVYGGDETDVTGTVTDGKCYNNTTGVESSTFSDAQTTGYILIDQSRDYYYSGVISNWAGGVCFYNNEYGFLGAFVTDSTQDVKVTVPKNAVYLTASTKDKNVQTLKIVTKEKSVRDIAEQNAQAISALNANVKINHIYVSTTGNDSTGDGTLLNPYATIYHANETITDNAENNRYIIHVADGTYTDLQTRFAGTTPTGYEGIIAKSHVTYEGNVENPSACKIVWAGSNGYDVSNYTYDEIGFYKCAFHVLNGEPVIRGFTIESTDTRYALHVECAGYGFGFNWLVSDCIFIWHGTPNCTDRTSAPPTIGTGSGNFENGHLLRCKIINDAGITTGWMNHDSANRYPNVSFIEGANIKIESCKFDGGGFNTSVIFRNTHDDGIIDGYDRFSIINCTGINNLSYILSGNATVCNWRAEVKCSDIVGNRFADEGLLQ